jgi:hypothetical protein
MTTLRSRLLIIVALTIVVTGCAASPPTDASPTPAPVFVNSPEAAVARVILAEPRLAGIAPLAADAIGQASWYEVAPASGVGAFVVTVQIGWGDCPAGCIDKHRWLYAVGPDGIVTIVSETGGAVPDDAWPNSTTAGRTGVGGVATAGPVCPVEKNPPDPACAARPVAGAIIVISDASGTEIVRVTTGATGAFFADVPPGGYVVEPRPVEGLLGTPGPLSVVVNAGIVVSVNFGYDTGIR